jgi:hypothetical protein
MPLNLPPGSANPAALNVYATWVFTPTPVAGASVSIFNNGTHTAYLGRSGVNQADGFPVAPGNKPVRLQNINYSLYGCSDVTVGASVSTTNAAYTAGTTSIVTASSIATATYGAGSVLIVGTTVNTGWEAVLVSAISTSGTTVTTSALISDHASGAVIYGGTALPSSIVVQAGVL